MGKTLSELMAPTAFDSWTVEAARKHVFDNRQMNGNTCPCCKSHVQYRPRKLNVGIAFGLVAFYRRIQVPPFMKDNFVHGGEYLGHYIQQYTFQHPGALIKGDWQKARLWSLIVRKSDWLKSQGLKPKKGEKASSLWSLTPLGVQFVRREVSLPERLFEFQTGMHDIIWDTSKYIYIDAAFENQFSLEELMSTSIQAITDY